MIPLSEPLLNGNEWKYIKDCLDTNWVSSVGKYVDLFEEEFAKYVGCPRTVAVINGTSALHLALRTLGIGSGDEVIVSALTFIAPVNAIKYVGATPVFADSQADTWNMDPEKIEEMITTKTKAIMPVHIYGHPVNMDPILELAKKHNLYVIEDATEALGSEYKGRKVGILGDVGIFSFNGNKIADKARFLCNQAKETKPNKEFYHPDIGFNFRLTNVLAAMGLAQLEQLPDFVLARRKNARLYTGYLQNVPGIIVQDEKPWAVNCFWLFSIVLEETASLKRDELINILASRGIDSRPFFTPVNMFPPYKECQGQTPVAYSLYQRGINLPSSVNLTQQNISYICTVITEFIDSQK